MNYSVDIKGDKELSLYLDRSAQSFKPKIVEALKDIGELVESESKKKFGSYQRGWQKLKRATVLAKYYRRALINKVKRPKLSGIAHFLNTGMADDPLVLNGELRDSIKHEVNANELEVVIFSDDKKAAVHEYGYTPKNIPARSYLRLTLWDEEQKIREMLSDKVGEIFK